MDELSLEIEGIEVEFAKRGYNIKVVNNIDCELKYKILIGREGVWTVLKDNFCYDREFKWYPSTAGNYHIIAQAKRNDSEKSFDYTVLRSMTVDINEESLIESLNISKDIFDIGDKVQLTVNSRKEPVMYRYYVSSKQGWRLIKDYTTEEKLTFTANESGDFELLVECKEPQSVDNFDDFQTVKFSVNNNVNVEIVDFQCLAKDLLVGEELIFKVNANFEDDRTGLFKFIKLNPDGTSVCVQEFSSRNMVSFRENNKGNYKLLCYIRDMYSSKPYDDRALMAYDIAPYEKIEIQSFTTDVSSPQVSGEEINLKTLVNGGSDLRYRYIIEGAYSEDSGYIRSNSYKWNSKTEGEYKITLMVRDESSEDEYEAIATIPYVIEEIKIKPVRISNINLSKEHNILVKDKVKITVEVDGGTAIKYAFIVRKNGIIYSKLDYNDKNWFELIPDMSGNYEIEVMAKDKYSDKDYDSHTVFPITVKKYIEGKIDHILVTSKEYFLVGDSVEIEAIVQNTQDTLIKYVTKINGQIVEETDFIQGKRIIVEPKCSGKYVIDLYVKNKKCDKEYDTKKEVKFFVNDSLPVNNTKISTEKSTFKVNEEIAFSASSEGGKNICYEFYIMKNGVWTLMQRYSRKNYYLFRPYLKGKYRILVLAKSHHRKTAYEDYANFEFRVKD
ncbi:MAG: triple tyrosine motif-containing protein [Sarcina sp.]